VEKMRTENARGQIERYETENQIKEKVKKKK
jgi:hypothetical protein